MVIYTKKGDKGITSNVLGKTYSKASMLMELQGGIDEINANIGFLRSRLSSSVHNLLELQRIDSLLKKIQYNLFSIGVEISMEFTKANVGLDEVKVLEEEIDYMTNKMKQLRNFIYQSGNEAAAYSHIIRSVVRRGERVFVRALEESEYPESYQYINRLSDYFFTLARYLNHLGGQEEEVLKLK
jgi:cob(I)alamin adenosyltransferase